MTNPLYYCMRRCQAAAAAGGAPILKDLILSEPGLLDYWPLDDASSPCRNLKGSASISVTGATLSEPSHLGACLSFDGVDDFSQSETLYYSGYNKLVVECMARIYSETEQLVLEFGGTILSYAGFYLAHHPTNGLLGIVNGDGGLNGEGTGSVRQFGEWKHIVCIYDKSAAATDEVAIYVNGSLFATTQYYSNNNTDNFIDAFLNLGKRQTGAALYSRYKIKDLAIYTDLSEEKIYAHSVAAFPSTPTDLMIVQGDSISDGSDDWPIYMYNATWDAGTLINLAQVGKTAATILSEYASKEGAVSVPPGKLGYYFLMAGINDLNIHATSAEVIASLTSIYSSANSDFDHVCASQILPSTAISGADETARQDINSWILSSAEVDTVVEVPALLSNPADPLYFADGTHLTLAGRKVLAAAVETAMWW